MNLEEETVESEFVGHDVILKLKSNHLPQSCHIHSAIFELGDVWFYKVTSPCGVVSYISVRDILSIEIVESSESH